MKVRYKDFFVFCKANWAPLTLTLVAILLCIVNYTPGTFLSGWDTLHPEFNFSLNFQRVLFGVFRPEQGLGAIAAHSHMADLPRIVLMWLVSPILPMSFLRYLPIFLMLILGPLGVFYLVRLVLRLNLKTGDKPLLPTLSAFLAGLWYLCNLGTVQQFVVPFEMFVFEYGFLPWLFYLAISYLYSNDQPKQSKLLSIVSLFHGFIAKIFRRSNHKTIQQWNNRSPLLLFALCSLLSSPMAYASTLWYMYFGFLCLFLFLHNLPSLYKRSFSLPKRSLILIFTTLLINAYWLLPNLYFLITQSATIENANINKLFSEQAFLYNKEFGTLPDILLLRSFFFDWSIFNGRDFEALLKPWSTYLENPLIIGIGFFAAGITIVGIIGSIWKKYALRFSLLGLLFFLLIFLFNDNQPTSFLFNFLKQTVPVLEEALRFPHNKVQILFMLIFAVYFGIGIHTLIDLATKRLDSFTKYKAPAFTTLVAILLLTFFAPAFTGQLISPYMRITIPQDYFSLFDWMNTQPGKGRAAVMPTHSFWGWEYHNWQNDRPSFQGAGFLWFGMNKPLLHRDFDRWSPYNEQAYRELAAAVYAKNPVLLATVAKKYHTQYFILDTSIIAPDEAKSVLYMPELQKLLSNTTFFEKKKTFGRFLSVYEVKTTQPEAVGLLTGAQNVTPEVQSLQKDSAFSKFGHYISDPTKQADVVFPFRSQVDNQNKIPPDLFSITQDGILIKPATTQNALSAGSLSYQDVGTDLPVTITLQKESNDLSISFYPLIPFKDSTTQPTPLRIETPSPRTNNITLSINQSDTFSVNTTLSENALAIGTSALSTANNNTVTVYEATPDLTQIVDVTAETFSLRPCESLDAGQVFGVGEKEQDEFNLFAKKTPVCLILPLSQLFPNPEDEAYWLLTSQVTYSDTDTTSSNDKASICVANLKDGSCTHYLARTTGSSEQSSYQHQFYTGVSRNELQTLGLRIALDASTASSLTKASFAKLSFSLTKPATIITIPKSLVLTSIEPALAKADVRSGVLVPYSGDKLLSQDLTKFPRTSGLCQENPLVLTGKTQRRIVSEGDDYIRYESESIPQCDHFSYLNNPHDLAHLLLITSRNIKGLPLTICVTNRTSKRCDIYARTTKSSSFVTDAFLVPPTDNAEDGYDVNINNLGVRGTPAVNDLASIQFIPYPLDWLTSLSTSTTNQKSTLTGLKATELNPHKYLVEPPEEVKPGSVLTFNQAFNSGWIAFEMANGQWQMANGMKNAFPFIFGKKLEDHILVNNWANGWLLPSSPTPSALRSTLVILFWPQYLFYLGLFITTSTLLLLFVRKSKKG